MKKSNALSLIGYALNIVKNQFLAIVAAVLVTTIIGFFSSGGSLELLRFLICFVVYLLLLYVNSWHQGSSDTNRVKLGKIPDNKFRGFLAGLIASIPGIVFAVLAFLSESGYVLFFEFMGQDGIVVINRFINFPLGVLYPLIEGKPALNILFPLFSVIISGIAYILGRHYISIKQIIIYKPDEK